MSLPSDLLEQAVHLASREPRRPKQASLRRAISAAYYALFHLLNAEAVNQLGANLSPARAAAMQRWFSHTETKSVCQTFLRSDFPRPAALAGLSLSPHLRLVATNFLGLQQARHQADYDMATSWTRWNTQQKVELAQNAFSAWAQIRGTEEANIFILSLLLWKNWEKERA